VNAALHDRAPLVSIVLATCNRLELLRLAIDSVLAQTFSDWELLIADDGSEDSTRAYLRALAADARVRVLWLDHCGNPGVVRNCALAQARGRYVAFMDSDDLWLPEKLERQLSALRATPGLRWSYTSYDCIDANGDPLPIRWVRHAGEIFDSLLRAEAMVALPTVMAERALLAEASGFDPEQRQAEYIELWLRLALRSEVVLLEQVLTRVRFHRDHYCRGGAWGLNCLRRMYGKIETQVSDERRLRMVRAARTRNAARLMRHCASRHDWREAGAVARSSFAFSWRAPHWWWNLAAASIRLLLPDSWMRVRRAGQPA